MGQRVAKLEPVHGFAAETTAAAILLATAHFGHAGLDDPGHLGRDHGRRIEPGRPGVRWGVARRILVAWVLTIPAAAALGARCAWVVLNALRALS